MKSLLSICALLSSFAAFAANLAGTVKFTNLSGFLFTAEGMSEDRKALIMSNGHGLDPLGLNILAAGEVRVDQPMSRKVKIYNGEGRVLVIHTQRLLYATLTSTDMAVYELGVTYKYLRERYGITPLTLAPEGPTAGLNVTIASAYKGRTYDCTVEAVLPGLREGGRSFIGSLRMAEGCGTVNGTSGSPMIDNATGLVVGISNTLNSRGGLCGVNNPCEVDAEGRVSAIRGRRYGQQTALLLACFDENFALQLDRPGCALPRRN